MSRLDKIAVAFTAALGIFLIGASIFLSPPKVTEWDNWEHSCQLKAEIAHRGLQLPGIKDVACAADYSSDDLYVTVDPFEWPNEDSEESLRTIASLWAYLLQIKVVDIKVLNHADVIDKATITFEEVPDERRKPNEGSL